MLVPFKKLDEEGNYRFGPAKIEEVLPLVTKYIKAPCTINSDGLLAYRNTLGVLGYTHTSVNHGAGQFVDAANPQNHTQSVEGNLLT